VLGSRVAGQGDQSGLTPQQTRREFLSSRLSYACLYGLTLTDIGPFRAIRAPPSGSGYGAQDLWLASGNGRESRQKGLRVKEVPVSCSQASRRSKVAGLSKGSYAGRLSFCCGRHSVMPGGISAMAFPVGIGLTNECNLRCPHCYLCPDMHLDRLTCMTSSVSARVSRYAR